MPDLRESSPAFREAGCVDDDPGIPVTGDWSPVVLDLTRYAGNETGYQASGDGANVLDEARSMSSCFSARDRDLIRHSRVKALDRSG